MKHSYATYFVAVILAALFKGTVAAQEAPLSNTMLNLEGGYGVLNTSEENHLTLWGSVGRRLGSNSFYGIEGGYLKEKKDVYTSGTFSIEDSRHAAYVGPFVERFWNHQRFGFSLRGGLGAWKHTEEYQERENGVEIYAHTDSQWLPATAFSGMAYWRLTPSVNVGAGVREILTFDSSAGEAFWATTLIPFARLSVSF